MFFFHFSVIKNKLGFMALGWPCWELTRLGLDVPYEGDNDDDNGLAGDGSVTSPPGVTSTPAVAHADSSSEDDCLHRNTRQVSPVVSQAALTVALAPQGAASPASPLAGLSGALPAVAMLLGHNDLRLPPVPPPSSTVQGVVAARSSSPAPLDTQPRRPVSSTREQGATAPGARPRAQGMSSPTAANVLGGDEAQRVTRARFCAMLMTLAVLLGVPADETWYGDVVARLGYLTHGVTPRSCELQNFTRQSGTANLHVHRRLGDMSAQAAYSVSGQLLQYRGEQIVQLEARFHVQHRRETQTVLLFAGRVGHPAAQLQADQQTGAQAMWLRNYIVQWLGDRACVLDQRNLVAISVAPSPGTWGMFLHNGVMAATPTQMGQIISLLPATLPDLARVPANAAVLDFATRFILLLDRLSEQREEFHQMFVGSGFLQPGDRDHVRTSHQGLIILARRIGVLYATLPRVRTAVQQLQPTALTDEAGQALLDDLLAFVTNPLTQNVLNVARTILLSPEQLATALLRARTYPEVLRAVLLTLDLYRQDSNPDVGPLAGNEFWTVLYTEPQELFPALRPFGRWWEGPNGTLPLVDLTDPRVQCIVALSAMQETYRALLAHYHVFITHETTRTLHGLTRTMGGVSLGRARALARELSVDEGRAVYEWHQAAHSLASRDLSLIQNDMDPEFRARWPVLSTMVQHLDLFGPPQHPGLRASSGWDLPASMRGRRILDWYAVEQLDEDGLSSLTETWDVIQAASTTHAHARLGSLFAGPVRGRAPRSGSGSRSPLAPTSGPMNSQDWLGRFAQLGGLGPVMPGPAQPPPAPPVMPGPPQPSPARPLAPAGPTAPPIQMQTPVLPQVGIVHPAPRPAPTPARGARGGPGQTGSEPGRRPPGAGVPMSMRRPSTNLTAAMLAAARMPNLSSSSSSDSTLTSVGLAPAQLAALPSAPPPGPQQPRRGPQLSEPSSSSSMDSVGDLKAGAGGEPAGDDDDDDMILPGLGLAPPTPSRAAAVKRPAGDDEDAPVAKRAASPAPAPAGGQSGDQRQGRDDVGLHDTTLLDLDLDPFSPPLAGDETATTVTPPAMQPKFNFETFAPPTAGYQGSNEVRSPAAAVSGGVNVTPCSAVIGLQVQGTPVAAAAAPAAPVAAPATPADPVQRVSGRPVRERRAISPFQTRWDFKAQLTKVEPAKGFRHPSPPPVTSPGPTGSGAASPVLVVPRPSSPTDATAAAVSARLACARKSARRLRGTGRGFTGASVVGVAAAVEDTTSPPAVSAGTQPAAPARLGLQALILRDVFPGAVPWHLMPQEDGAGPERRHVVRRPELLAAPMVHPATGRPLVLRNTARPLTLRLSLLRDTPGTRLHWVRRPPAELDPVRAALRDFRPFGQVSNDATDEERQLDDLQIAQVTREWAEEFEDVPRVQFVDAVIMSRTRARFAGVRSFEALDPTVHASGPPVRFQLVPLFLDGRTDATMQARENELVAAEARRAWALGEPMNLTEAYATVDSEARGHWVLLVADLVQHQLYFADPAHSQHYRFRFQSWFDLPGNPFAGFELFDWQPRGDLQKDGWSCGYRVLSWMRYLAIHFGLGGQIPDEDLPMYPREYPCGKKRDGGEGGGGSPAPKNS